MFELLFSILITVCLLFGLMHRYLPFASIVTGKKKRLLKNCYAAVIVANLVAVWVALSTFGISLTLVKVSGMIFAVVTTLINICVIRKGTGQQLFIFGVVISINYMMMAVPSYLSNYFEVKGTFLRPIAVILMYLLLLTATFYPMRRMLHTTVTSSLQLDTDHYWTLIWLIPLSVFISMLLIYPFETRIYSITPLISGGVTSVMIVLMCMIIANDCRRMLEQREVEEYLKNQQIYFAELNASVEEARRARHDLKHKLNAIIFYLDKNDFESLRLYCHELMEQTGSQLCVQNSSSALLGGVLHRYSRQAELEQVRFIYTEQYKADWVADMDLCVLLGNVLDNAIEACRLAEKDRRIAVTIRGDESVLNILVQNTFDGELDIRENKIFSRKGEGRIGVGLRSIQEICDKYDGFVEHFVDEHLFSVNVLLRCQK